jgi:hypothetical protein
MDNQKGFYVKYLYSFKRYKYIKEDVILKSFLTEIEDYSLPQEVTDVFKLAWNSRFWEDKGYDGATLVKDVREPRLDNFIHDYLYRSGYYGNEADVIYREMLIMTGYSKFKAYRRYYVIRSASPYFWFKHTKNNNVKRLPPEVDELFYVLKNRKK